MKFTCSSKILTEALLGVSRAVSTSSNVPVLQGILIKASGFKLELTAYDLEMTISTSITANIIVPGEIVLPAKLFVDMMRNILGEEVSLYCDENLNTKIESGETKFNLTGLSAEDFPELPSPSAENAFEINSAELARMIETTIYAVSNDDKKPAHTGELFSIKPGNLTIVALDGFRLAITKYPLKTDLDISIVVPSKTCSEVFRLMGDCEEEIKINANKRYVIFSNNKYTIISRLLEGEFLNYENVMPESYKTRVIVNVPELEKAIESCSVIITERNKNPIRVIFGNDISISCQTVLGRSNASIAAKIEGEEVEIGFNNRYLLDALHNSGSNRVILEINGPFTPVKVLPAEGDDFIFLVLPVRFKND